MKKLSIIVLSYNHEDFISQNLQGIFMQKVNFPIELILCDDSSSDHTQKTIENSLQIACKNTEIKYFPHKKNKGSTPNFYFALKQVTGDYIAFCEGDDYWTDINKLQLQWNFLEKNQEYAMCFHQVINVSPHPKYNNTPFSIVENRDYTPEEIYKHWMVHTASVMMKSEVLKTEAFKETLRDPTLQYFDTVLFLAASTIGKIRGFSKEMSAYRRHDAGLSFGPKNFERDLKHNHLDEIIGEFHKKEIKKIADWQIFSRSRINFHEAAAQKNTGIALKNLKWILKKYKILRIYILKKIKN